MAPLRDDYLLRTIEHAFQVLRRILGCSTEQEIPDALRDLDGALDEVLGPAASVVQRLDAATAVPLIADPNRAGVWARLLAERAGLLREASDPTAPAVAARALEVALEARALGEGDPRLLPVVRDAVAEAISLSAAQVDPTLLTGRSRALLTGPGG
jgi:hypothetical protein